MTIWRLWIFAMVSVVCSAAHGAALAPESWQLASPDGRLVATIRQSVDGGLRYAVSLDDRRVVESSQLGLELRWVDQAQPEVVQHADFVRTVTVQASTVDKVEDAYKMVTGKRRINRYAANQLVLHTRDDETGRLLDIEFQLADDGLAFRYVLAGRSAVHSWIEREATEFAFGPGGTIWGQPYDKANVWQPAYEAPYNRGVAVGTTADGPGWGIPALLRDENGLWILVHESGLGRSYHGSHLAAEAPGGTYRIAPPLASDGLGFGDTRAATTLPAALPWRFMVISERLATIVESNRVFDLAPPAAIADASWIAPGVASWSWQSDHDSSRDLDKLKSFIDLAAEQRWSYSLVDANWNLIAPDAMEQLVAYADARKVGLLFWYNSGGRHNAVTEEPRNLMDDRVRRRAEFARLEKLGVKGVKIDFFQSDKQDRIAQYLDILDDAAEFHLLVNFHGCTIPRGWQRTYPHLMTMEAVRGAEHYSFDSEPNFAELSTYQDSVLPFTRNVIGSMDFTPVLFSRQHRERLTTSAHEAALGVVFESGLQHLADSVAGYRGLPADYRSYLAELPTAWDETRFLAGAPGEGIVLARRSGQRWYVAGITASRVPTKFTIDLRFLEKPAQALWLLDAGDRNGFRSRRQVVRPSMQTINVEAYGGFVMVIDPVRHP